ncbi:MarR family winged helix-turn-helix transcriptional regulator [Actinomyces sp. Marseille-P3109]|uniref:MarR family winged helix-turn-helix transcriptional regulator n=1 Tax=Actinomyces sp. Marseille-P3109 TaxID=2083009 RepID=UPI001F1B0043|nr:MarR family transcriptional regulator [Actinomyces sp. Marseille-P3109]
MITAERTMVEPTSYTEDVEMKWTQSDQEAVEATYSQETVGAVGSTRCGQEPAGTCGQESAQTCGQDGSAEQDGFRRLDEIEMDAWRSFLAASTSVTARLNRELEAGCGISMHEYEILVRLSEAPDHTLRMSTLAEHVSHSRSRLTHTVRRLESAGYVERTSCDSDRRGVNCMLTQAGLDFLCDAAPVHLDGVRRHVIDRLGQEQQLAMAELMKVIAQAPDSSASSVLSASSAS